MHPRANQLIRILNLQPHPEGGHFVEAFRSPLTVSPADGRGSRSALTAIYFLLLRGGFSRWHRVLSDEAWHWYEGSPIELFTIGPNQSQVAHTTLGPLSESSKPLHVVPAGWWQAARTEGDYSLVGCAVGPGFDYSDFTLLASIPEVERPVFASGANFADLL